MHLCDHLDCHFVESGNFSIVAVAVNQLLFQVINAETKWSGLDPFCGLQERWVVRFKFLMISTSGVVLICKLHNVFKIVSTSMYYKTGETYETYETCLLHNKHSNYGKNLSFSTGTSVYRIQTLIQLHARKNLFIDQFVELAVQIKAVIF